MGNGIDGISTHATVPVGGTVDTTQATGTGGVPGGAAAPQIQAAQTQARQVIGQRPLSEIGAGLSTRREALERAIDQWESTAPPRSLMPKSVGVIMPPSDTTVRLEGAMMEAEIKGLPRDERAQAVKDAPLTLQARITHGQELFEGVRGGTITGPASSADVRDLMTFLTARAQQKTDAFSDGALSIPDPGNRLRNYLDSSAEVYQRPSSHIAGFRDAQGGAHRGIDFGDDVKLPYGKGTLLYGALRDGVNGMPGERLFLKMESHGCRLTAGKAQNRDADGPTDRPLRFWKDLGQTLAHGMGFFQTALRKISGGRLFPDDPGSRKERIPQDLKNDYRALVQRFSDAADEGTAGILGADSPTADDQGIRTMVRNLRQALESETLGGGARQEVQAMLDRITARFDHLDVRIGNEVVMDEAELGGQDLEAFYSGQLRSAVKDLLGTGGPEGVTPDRVQNFLQQLSRMGLSLEHAGGADDSDRIIHSAIAEVTGNLSPQDKVLLGQVLNSAGIKRAMGDMLSVVMTGTRHLQGDIPGRDGLDTAVRVARTSATSYLALATTVTGSEPALDLQAELTGDMTKDVLVQVGRDAHIAWGSKESAREDRNAAAMGHLRIGAMPLDLLRGRIDRGTIAVGDVATSLVRGPIDREQVGASLLASIRADQAQAPATMRYGLPEQFVKDFLRNGATVDGVNFGGSRCGSTEGQIQQEVDRFVEAMGGLEKAQQACRVAHQALGAMLLNALAVDAGVGELAQTLLTHTGQTQTEGQYVSFVTHGDDMGVQFSYGEQREGSMFLDWDAGYNMTLEFTLQGVGQQDAQVRLDHWDVLFGTKPSVQVGESSLDDLRAALGTAHSLGVHVASMGGGTVHDAQIKSETHVELNILLYHDDPDYMGLSRAFVEDFASRPIEVNGELFGGDGIGEGDYALHEELDRFIDAVGGVDQAVFLSRVANRMTPQALDRVAGEDPGLGEKVVGYGRHQAPALSQSSGFSVAVRDDGTMDVRYESREQKAADDDSGQEMGKLVRMDFSLTGLDGEAPDLTLDGWDMIIGSNHP